MASAACAAIALSVIAAGVVYTALGADNRATEARCNERCSVEHAVSLGFTADPAGAVSCLCFFDDGGAR